MLSHSRLTNPWYLVRNFHTPVPNFRGPPLNIQSPADISEAGLQICYRPLNVVPGPEILDPWSNSEAIPRNIQTGVPIHPNKQLVPAPEKLQLFTNIGILPDIRCMFTRLNWVSILKFSYRNVLQLKSDIATKAIVVVSCVCLKDNGLLTSSSPTVISIQQYTRFW